ncbi:MULTISPECIES: hypothetical protein [unclassified Mesorhizobium]|uniref:hypothetical protein n=1 Tax=unclassified Mesorhizobium TaxID=325217 RepID=UPI00333DC154
MRGVDLAPLDQLQNVICVRAFPKTLSANLRCGYIAARQDLIASLAELKMLTNVNSSGHIERLIHGLISEGHYRRTKAGIRVNIAWASDPRFFDFLLRATTAGLNRL